MKINLHCAYITKQLMNINDTQMYSYTFCDLSSGNNFSVYSLTPVKAYESFKQLQVNDIDFDLQVTKKGLFKVKPIKEA